MDDNVIFSMYTRVYPWDFLQIRQFNHNSILAEYACDVTSNPESYQWTEIQVSTKSRRIKL